VVEAVFGSNPSTMSNKEFSKNESENGIIIRFSVVRQKLTQYWTQSGKNYRVEPCAEVKVMGLIIDGGVNNEW
jgi:hypothetical protein